MDDVFKPPEERGGLIPWRLAGAGCLGSIALAAAFVTVAGLLQDLVYLPQDRAMGPGSLLGAVIGSVLRTGCFGTVSLLAFGAARAVYSPEEYGTEAISSSELQDIYARERLSERDLGDPGPYADSEPFELVDVYEHIDATKFPAKHVQLLSAIKARAERESTDGQ